MHRDGVDPPPGRKHGMLLTTPPGKIEVFFLNWRGVWSMTLRCLLLFLLLFGFFQNPSKVFSQPAKNPQVERNSSSQHREVLPDLRISSVAPPLAGDTYETAFEVSGIPFWDNGTTYGFHNDYQFPCASQSSAADVVYRFTPGTDLLVSVDLCLSSFNPIFAETR